METITEMTLKGNDRFPRHRPYRAKRSKQTGESQGQEKRNALVKRARKAAAAGMAIFELFFYKVIFLLLRILGAIITVVVGISDYIKKIRNYD